MIGLLLIRHGRTPWNASGRIQGRRDIALSATGRAELSARRIPPAYAHFAWFASPLERATESARMLGARDLQTDPRLVELHWGQWQGSTRKALRARYGEGFAENEARGLDFRPPGGESPGELQSRFRAWLAERYQAGLPAIAVTHKGVIQMALAMATGWDLVSRAPVRLDWRCAQLFEICDHGARLRLEQVNVSLEAGDDGGRRADP